jgi:ABC-type multidrug transport system, ATPase and permease components
VRSQSHNTIRLSDLRRFLAFARPYRARFALAGACILAGSVLHFLFPYLIGVLIDDVFLNQRAAYGNTALQLVAVIIGGALADFLRAYQTSYLSERIISDLREHLYEHVQSLSMSYYDEHRTGDVLSHISNDAAVVQSTLSSVILSFPQYIFMLVLGVVIIFLTNWRLSLYLACALPLLVGISLAFGGPLRRLSRTIQEQFSAWLVVMEEGLTCQRIVRAFGRNKYEAGRFAKTVESYFQTSTRRARIQAAFDSVVTMTIFASLAGLFWVGGREIMLGRLTTGGLVSFIIYGTFLISPLTGLSRLYIAMQTSLGAGERILALLDIKPEVVDSPDAYDLPDERGAIEITDLTFAYGRNGDSARPVLRGINLTIPQGKTVAVVGPSGAGKTTLINLIARFYEQQSGAITIAGHSLASITQDSLRKALAVVPQDTVLFNGTVRENIAYGKLDASQEEIVAAAQAANAHDFISQLPEGYETKVGERGVKLSGGQRQRIAIARAILKNPHFLILDEATSSLDNESERLVQDALERLMQGRTTLVIAHRLTTVEQADEIVVLKDGEIVERGTHKNLLAQAGMYHRLYTRNLKSENAPAEDKQRIV